MGEEAKVQYTVQNRQEKVSQTLDEEWEWLLGFGAWSYSSQYASTRYVATSSNAYAKFFFRSMAIGVLARATLVSAVYKRALSMTVEARAAHPNGQLTTLVSSDVSRMPLP